MSVYSHIPIPKHSVSKYRLKPTNSMSFNFGGLYPLMCRTVLPGDKWSISLQTFLRTVPLISPVMHRNDIKVDAFYVPFRLIWKSAEKWFECDTSVSRPKVKTTNQVMYDNLFGPGGLYDYFNFGSPKYSVLQSMGISLHAYTVSALPLRAYRMIYDFYYRNKSLEPEITDTLPDFYGDSDLTIGSLNTSLLLQYRSWRRDIFTSALPTPQTGSDVLIPTDLSGTQVGLNVAADGTLTLVSDPDHQTNRNGDIYSTGGDIKRTQGTEPIETGSYQKYSHGLKVTGNVSNLQNRATIRQLRYGEQLEKYEEAMARSGFGDTPGYGHGKFKEWLRGIWGEKSRDARLDRPEYLGGYRGPIQISEVPQTAASTASSPQGNLAGKGLSVGGNRLFGPHHFEEPGILMIICSVTPKSAYCQGTPREWLYETGFDFPNPFFDSLGEQEVKAEEINCLAKYMNPSLVPQTFGYNVRYYEMKDFPDEIHGALRDNLAFWHEGRMFDWDDFPGLNTDFVKVKPGDVSRIFPSTENSDKLILESFFDIKLKRNLSYYGLPRQNA